MKKLNKVLIVLLTLAMLLSVAACGNTANNTAGGTTTANATTATAEASTAPAATAPAGDKSITIWCWDNSDTRKQMHADFTKEMGITVNLTSVLAIDMAQKLQTTLAAGGEMPDIAWSEATYRGALLNLGIWEDITKAPYSFDTSKVLDYLVQLETSVDGQYIGPECPSVAGIAYKRELAKQYFGTDDPAELEKMFPTWNDFIAKGKEVQQKSNGKVFMFSSLGALGLILKGQGATPFVTGDKITFTDSMKPILSQVSEFAKAGVVDVYDYDSAEEGASYATKEDIFYPCANWSVKFTIETNDKNGNNKWGFMLPPGGGFAMGGTVMAVPAAAKHKEDAVTYIKYFFQDERGAALQKKYKGNFSPFKPLYEKSEPYYTTPDPFFSNQDVMKDIQTRVLPSIKNVRTPVPYDQAITDAYNLALKSINAAKGNVNVDDLLKTMADQLITNNPGLSREN